MSTEDKDFVYFCDCCLSVTLGLKLPINPLQLISVFSFPAITKPSANVFNVESDARNFRESTSTPDSCENIFGRSIYHRIEEKKTRFKMCMNNNLPSQLFCTFAGSFCFWTEISFGPAAEKFNISRSSKLRQKDFVQRQLFM